MQEKKEIKIKFKTAVILVLLLLIVIITIFAVMINRKEQNEIGRNTTIIGNEVVEQATDSDFSMKFLKMENNKQNMIYSPLSIKYALKMLNEGANGNTKTVY